MSQTCCMWAPFGGRPSPVLVDEALLVDELNNLSVEEREMVNEEVHGVAGPIEETSAMIKEGLEQMRVELTKVPQRRRRSFDRALFLKPSLESDDKFHLIFLRADRFDAAKAASRMCKFFDSKLQLFGEDKLVKKITLDDLDEDDMAVVRTGACHALPNKDQSGRLILFINMSAFRFKTWQNMARYAFYQTMAVLEDEDVQIRGLIEVVRFVDMGDNANNIVRCILSTRDIVPNFPIRRSAFHLYTDDPKLQSLMSLIKMIADKDTRLHGRYHFGSELEVKYALMSFGIRLGPFVDDLIGSFTAKRVQSYLEERREKEAACARQRQEKDLLERCIVYPNPNDILVGRGRPYRDHAGTAILAKIVHSHADIYAKVEERHTKSQLAHDICQGIKKDGGRFLRRTLNGWVQVDDEVAREKISKALRYEVRQRVVGGINGQSQQMKESSSIDDDEESEPVPNVKRLRSS